MKYFAYILQSEKDLKYYIGSTNNIFNRINAHNRGSVKSTKHRRPFKLIYYEELQNRSDAVK